MTKIRRVYEKDGRHYYVQDLEERNPRTGRPKQRWIPLTRVDEGQPALIKALDELLGKPAERRGTLPDHIEEFKKVLYPNVKPYTRDEYERMLGEIATGFKQFDSADVEPGDIITFLQDNFATKLNTRSKYKGLLSSFFSWCCLNSHTGVKVNPCREIKMSRPPKRRGKLNAERFWKIWDNLTPMGRCALELLYLTRQRPTEIRLLRDSHIGPADCPDYIHFVPTKTEDETAEEVRIRITPEIRDVIARARALRRKPKVVELSRQRDPFIIQTRTGDGYSKNGFYEVWRDAIDAAGYTGMNITTRDVRPFALAQMEKLGFDLREIQKVATHSSVTTTEGYLDQHRERLSDARIPLPERMR
jgi:integrase